MQQFSSLLSWPLFIAQHVSGVFPTHHQELNDCSGSLWFYLRIVVTVVLCSWSGRSAYGMLPTRSGLTNLWLACPKWTATFTTVSFVLYFLCPISVTILWIICKHTYLTARIASFPQVGKPEVKMQLGRPRRRWEDNIKMDLQVVGGGRGNWKELAQDRDRWRALVGTVRDFRVP